MATSKWLNSKRQQLKFYKDIYYHYFKNKFIRGGTNVCINKDGEIPKILHYAWFGRGKKPDVVNKCIETWSTYFKDYKIILWDESNFPFEKYPFAQEAYAKGKYAFVADVARLHSIYHYGGIYMDTDCEVKKSLDDLLQLDAFACYESPNLITIGTLGAKKYHEFVWELLTWYMDVDFSEDYAEIASTRIISKMFRVKYEIKLDGKEMTLPDGTHIFPREYFCPDKENGEWKVTNDTYVVHHFTGLW